MALAAFAGSITDRYSRRRIMLICDLVSALVALMVTLVVWSGSLNVPLLGRVAAVFHESAFEASYAMLLPESQLARASGLMQTSYSAGATVAPALAALIIAFPGRLGGLWGLSKGTGLVMVLDTLSFVAAPFSFCSTFPARRSAPLRVRKLISGRISSWAGITSAAAAPCCCWWVSPTSLWPESIFTKRYWPAST